MSTTVVNILEHLRYGVFIYFKNGGKSIMDTKIVIYTALFGDYDELLEPVERFDNCDFICFTDNENLKSDLWDIKVVEKVDLPLNMMNRRYKLFPHEYLAEYKYSIYIDANIRVNQDITFLIQKYLMNTNKFIAIPRHPHRKCFYDEAPLLIRAGRVSFIEIYKQYFAYRKLEYYGQIFLTENNIILREHNNEKCINLMKDWWEELNKFTQRDQISLGYVIFKNNVEITFMDENARSNDIFTIYKHNNNNNNYIKYLSSLLPYIGAILFNLLLKRRCRWQKL